MNSKIFTNGSIATSSWKTTIGKVSVVLFAVIPLILLSLLMIPAAVLWLISLGHVNFVGILNEVIARLDNKVFPDPV